MRSWRALVLPLHSHIAAASTSRAKLSAQLRGPEGLAATLLAVHHGILLHRLQLPYGGMVKQTPELMRLHLLDLLDGNTGGSTRLLEGHDSRVRFQTELSTRGLSARRGLSEASSSSTFKELKSISHGVAPLVHCTAQAKIIWRSGKAPSLKPQSCMLPAAGMFAVRKRLSENLAICTRAWQLGASEVTPVERAATVAMPRQMAGALRDGTIYPASLGFDMETIVKLV